MKIEIPINTEKYLRAFSLADQNFKTSIEDTQRQIFVFVAWLYPNNDFIVDDWMKAQIMPSFRGFSEQAVCNCLNEIHAIDQGKSKVASGAGN